MQVQFNIFLKRKFIFFPLSEFQLYLEISMEAPAGGAEDQKSATCAA